MIFWAQNTSILPHIILLGRNHKEIAITIFIRLMKRERLNIYIKKKKTNKAKIDGKCIC